MFQIGRVIISCLNIFNLNKVSMENEFYATLLSNSSMKYFPENKTSAYTVHLTKEVNLDGKWNVALSEITFPTMIHNVSTENNTVFIHYKSFEKEEGLITWKPHRIEIPHGSYKDVYEIINTINSAASAYTNCKFFLLSLENEKVKITKDRIFQESLEKTFLNAREAMLEPPDISGASLIDSADGKKAAIEVNCEILKIELKGLQSEQGIYLEFEGRLALQLGFIPETLIKIGESASDRPDMILGIPPEIFVYIDVVEPQIISDSSSQVVRIVKTHDNQKTHAGGIIVREFVHRNYLPLIKNRFQSIQVELRDTTGKFIPFSFGTSSASLHFKRSS